VTKGPVQAHRGHAAGSTRTHTVNSQSFAQSSERTIGADGRMASCLLLYTRSGIEWSKFIYFDGVFHQNNHILYIPKWKHLLKSLLGPYSVEVNIIINSFN